MTAAAPVLSEAAAAEEEPGLASGAAVNNQNRHGHPSNSAKADYLLRSCGTVAWAFRTTLDSADHIHSGTNFTEDCMLAVEPAANHCGEEELRATSVWSGIGHRQ